MTSLAIVSFLAGVVVGWWFTISILVVAIFIASVIVAGVGAAVASLWWATLDVVVVTMGLQLGYVAGSALETCAAVRGRPRAFRESRQAADESFEPPTALIMDGRQPCSSVSAVTTILRRGSDERPQATALPT